MGNKKAGSSEERLSVFLSLVLRHQPEAAGITLDEHGWADVEALIQGISGTGRAAGYGAAGGYRQNGCKGAVQFQ